MHVFDFNAFFGVGFISFWFFHEKNCFTSLWYIIHLFIMTHFHMMCLCRLLKVFWKGKVSDTEVLTWTQLACIHMLLRKVQMRSVDHVPRIPNKHLPKELSYSELSKDKHSHGSHRKSFNISPEILETTTKRHVTWCSLISKEISTFERAKTAMAQKEHKLHKSKTSSHPATPTDFCVPNTSVFRSEWSATFRCSILYPLYGVVIFIFSSER